MTKLKKFYVTTPIYYANDVPHLGHAYTTIAADILARWHRVKGEEVFFLTGLDEHGQKISEAAAEKGVTPQELVDSLAPRFQKIWKLLHISNDDFIRTTEERHKRIVQEILKRIYEKSDIYKGEYEGWYCVRCESFWTGLQLVNNKCPECQRDVKRLKEESYFFRLSRYQKRLLEFYEKNPDFISPETRKNEVLSRVKNGLKDISITRATVKWGIPFPVDTAHTVYVWVEALMNYVTVLEYPNGEKFRKFWPADVELMGKEINWFHSVIWPALLFSAGIEPPNKNFVHGWWTIEGRKMSKSIGNVVNPVEMVEKYGADSFRYFLFREVPFGEDGDFSEKALVKRHNSELADALGNLVNRVLSLVEKNFDGLVPKPFGKSVLSRPTLRIIKSVDDSINRFQFRRALYHIFDLAHGANKFINETKPWEIEDKNRLATILYDLLEVIRITTILLYPFTPETSEKISEQLGKEGDFSFRDLNWGALKPGTKTKRRELLFKKIIHECI